MSIIFKKSRRDFKKLGWRSILMIVVISLSLGGTLALLYAIDASKPMIENYYEEANHADYTYQLGDTTWINQNELDGLQNLDTIKNYTGRLFWATSIKIEGDDDWKYLLLIGLDEDIDEPNVYKYKIDSGKNFNQDESNISAILDKTFADINNINVNDIIKISGMGNVDLKITGTFTSAEFLSQTSNPEIFLPIEGSMGIIYLSKNTLKTYILKYLNDMYLATLSPELLYLISIYSTSDYNNIVVTFNGDIEEGNTATQEYLENICNVNIKSSGSIEDSYGYSNLKDSIEQSSEFMFIILLLMIFMGVLIVFVIFNRYVLSQKQQLGVLEAIGYTKKDLINYFMFNIMIISIISIPTGILIGHALGYLLIGELFSQMANISLLDIPYISLPNITYLGIIIGIGMIILSTYIPIHKIRSNEISDLIYKQTDIDYKIKSKKHLKKRQLSKKENVSDILVFHNLFKNKKRLVLTVGAITCALLIISTGQSIIDSIYQNIDRTFNTSGTISEPSEAWDLDIHFQTALNLSIQEYAIDNIKGIEGIQKGEIYSKGYVTTNKGNKDELLLLYGMDWENTKGHNFKWKYLDQNNSIPKYNNEIVISSIYSAKLNKEIGDNIEIKYLGSNYNFKIVGIHNELVVCCYVTKEAANIIFHNGQNFANGIYLMLEKDTDPENVKEIIYGMTNIGIILDSQKLGTQMNDYINKYFILFEIIVNYAFLVAFFIILYNSIMNIYDKNYEYGILRSLGFSKRKIFNYILVENILQGLIPIILSLIFTYPLANYIASIYEQQFPILVYVGISTFLIVILPVIFLSAIGAIIGLKTVYKQNLYEQVQTSFVG